MTTHWTGRRVGATAAGTPTLSGANVIDNPQTDFDGCYRKCRIERRHTMEYGGCEHADKPEPMVSMSKVYTDSDGYPSIGYDQYTVPQLAHLIEAAVGDPLRAAAAARVIVHRNDDPAVLPAVPVPPATHATVRAAVYRELADQQTQLAVADDLARRRDAAAARRQLVKELRRMAAEAQQQPTTVDKAAALGMTDTEYRAHSHRAAMDAIRAAVPGLYASVALRVEDALAEAQQQPDTGTRAAWGTRPRCTCSHAVDEHSVYGCLDDCACEWMPKRKPMDPVHILGIEAVSGPGRVADEDPAETPEVVHACPPDGSGLTPCCGRTPFELPLGDRISSEAPITCRGAQ